MGMDEADEADQVVGTEAGQRVGPVDGDSNTDSNGSTAVDELLLAGDGAYLVGVAVQLRRAGQVKAAGRVLAISAALLAMPADSWSEARRTFG